MVWKTRVDIGKRNVRSALGTKNWHLSHLEEKFDGAGCRDPEDEASRTQISFLGKIEHDFGHRQGGNRWSTYIDSYTSFATAPHRAGA